MNLNIIMAQPQRLIPHPYNRDFPTEGEEWEQFVESIKFRGVMSPIMVRKSGHDWQIVAGHRRTKAALTAGLREVPIQVEDLSDKEAMEIVFVDNLLAVGLSTYDEALGVKGLLETGYTPETLAKRCCKDIRWVKTRQGVFDLGDEVIEAVKKPKEDPGHLPVRSLEEILKVPDELRGQAIQLVLNPEFQPEVLSPMQAKDVLEARLIKPHAARLEWEKTREKLAKEWKKRLAKLCLKGTKGDLVVMSMPWESCEATAKGGVPADRPVPMGEQSADAPQFMCWLHLAVRHGMPVRVVHDPAGGQDKSLALVDVRVLQDAEESRAAIDQLGKPVDPEFKPWLITRARGAISREPAAPAATGKDEGPTFAEMNESFKEVLETEKMVDCWKCAVSVPIGQAVGVQSGLFLCGTCSEKTRVTDLADETDGVPAFLRGKNDPATAGKTVESEGGDKDSPDDSPRFGECDRCSSDGDLDRCHGCGKHVCLSCVGEDQPSGWKCKECAPAADGDHPNPAVSGLEQAGWAISGGAAVIDILAVARVAMAAGQYQLYARTLANDPELPAWAQGMVAGDVILVCEWVRSLIQPGALNAQREEVASA